MQMQSFGTTWRSLISMHFGGLQKGLGHQHLGWRNFPQKGRFWPKDWRDWRCPIAKGCINWHEIGWTIWKAPTTKAKQDGYNSNDSSSWYYIWERWPWARIVDQVEIINFGWRYQIPKVGPRVLVPRYQDSIAAGRSDGDATAALAKRFRVTWGTPGAGDLNYHLPKNDS